MSASRKPRLLVLNQYYWPGVEATANLLTELCEALVATYDVTVVAGASPGCHGPPRRAGSPQLRLCQERRRNIFGLQMPQVHLRVPLPHLLGGESPGKLRERGARRRYRQQQAVLHQ